MSSFSIARYEVRIHPTLALCVRYRACSADPRGLCFSSNRPRSAYLPSLSIWSLHSTCHSSCTEVRWSPRIAVLLLHDRPIPVYYPQVEGASSDLLPLVHVKAPLPNTPYPHPCCSNPCLAPSRVEGALKLKRSCSATSLLLFPRFVHSSRLAQRLSVYLPLAA